MGLSMFLKAKKLFLILVLIFSSRPVMAISCLEDLKRVADNLDQLAPLSEGSSEIPSWFLVKTFGDHEKFPNIFPRELENRKIDFQDFETMLQATKGMSKDLVHTGDAANTYFVRASYNDLKTLAQILSIYGSSLRALELLSKHLNDQSPQSPLLGISAHDLTYFLEGSTEINLGLFQQPWKPEWESARTAQDPDREPFDFEFGVSQLKIARKVQTSIEDVSSALREFREEYEGLGELKGVTHFSLSIPESEMADHALKLHQTIYDPKQGRLNSIFAVNIERGDKILQYRKELEKFPRVAPFASISRLSAKYFGMHKAVLASLLPTGLMLWACIHHDADAIGASFVAALYTALSASGEFEESTRISRLHYALFDSAALLTLFLGSHYGNTLSYGTPEQKITASELIFFFGAFIRTFSHITRHPYVGKALFLASLTAGSALNIFNYHYFSPALLPIFYVLFGLDHFLSISPPKMKEDLSEFYSRDQLFESGKPSPAHLTEKIPLDKVDQFRLESELKKTHPYIADELMNTVSTKSSVFLIVDQFLTYKKGSNPKNKNNWALIQTFRLEGEFGTKRN
ncbi:MAG: hypothetical protein JWQ35_1585 [Bacteriovoracaceae bacterium]|nr:hypothetical protein [Bacteriovoracaceae bacterium]